MRQRIVALSVLAASIALAACSGEQSGTEQESTAVALTYPSGAPHPVTEWGDPDLRGTWPIQHLIGTPFQRGEEFGTRAEYTEEEFQARAETLETTRNARYEEEIANNKIGMGHWAETTDAQRINSLLVDPPNGRFPELTARGQELATTMGSSWSTESSGQGFDSIADFDTWDRCITRGLPPSMFPFNYNNGIEIHQAPGYVIVRLEMVHEARVIPVDGRAPLDPAIKHWMGESRGHFEGNTLVVETTNFNGKNPFRGASEELKVTERFTRVAQDQILYRFTVEDPATWAKPWTAEAPMAKTEGPIFEFACHESNYGIANILAGARAEERRAAEAAAKKGSN
jgi:hypothetical protein